MTSTTSSANSVKQTLTMMRWTTKNSMGITGIYAALMVLLYPLAMLIQLSSPADWIQDPAELSRYMEERSLNYLNNLTWIGAITLIVLFAVILTVWNFGYMHRKRQVDLFHALPLSRTAQFTGRFLSSVLCLVVPALVAVLLMALVLLGYGYLTPVVSGKLLFIALFLVAAVIIAFAFSVFVAVCSGSTLDTLASLVFITASYPLTILAGCFLINRTLPGELGIFDNFTTFAFTPFAGIYYLYVLLTQPHVEGIVPTPGVIAWWAVLTLLLLLGALHIYRRRKSESAESVVSYSPAKLAIRILSSVCAGICGGFLALQVTQSRIWFFVALVIISLLAYAVTELIYKKTLRQLHRHIVPYCGVLVVFALFLTALSLGFFGLDMNTPPIEDISYVAVNKSQYAVLDEEDLGDDEVHSPLQITNGLSRTQDFEKLAAANKKLVESARAVEFPYLPGSSSVGRSTAALRQEIFGYPPSLHLIYYMKDGSSVQRIYNVPWSSEEAIALYLEACKELRTLFSQEENLAGMPELLAPEAFISFSETRYPKKDGEGIFTEQIPVSESLRKELHAALEEDLQENPFAATCNQEGTYYDFIISTNTTFTAGGGFIEGKPVAGETFTTTGEAGSGMRITENYPRAYALLEKVTKETNVGWSDYEGNPVDENGEPLSDSNS